MESIFGPLGVDFWPLSNDRGIELGTLEVVIESQGIEFRPLGFENRFFNHNVNFLGLCYPISDSWEFNVIQILRVLVHGVLSPK